MQLGRHKLALLALVTLPFLGLGEGGRECSPPGCIGGGSCFTVASKESFETLCDSSTAGSHCCSMPKGTFIDVAGLGNQLTLEVNDNNAIRLDVYCNGGGFINSSTSAPILPFVTIEDDGGAPSTSTPSQIFLHDCKWIGNDTADGEVAIEGGGNWIEVHLVNPSIVDGFHQATDQAIVAQEPSTFLYIWSVQNGSLNSGGPIITVMDSGQFRIANSSIENSGTGGLCAHVHGANMYSTGNTYFGCDGFELEQDGTARGTIHSTGDTFVAPGLFSGRTSVFQVGDSADTQPSSLIIEAAKLEGLGYLGYADPQTVTEIFDLQQAAVVKFQVVDADDSNTESTCAGLPWSLTLFDGTATEPPPTVLEVEWKEDTRTRTGGTNGQECWFGTTFSANMLTQLGNAPGSYGYIRSNFRDQLITPTVVTAAGGAQQPNRVIQCESDGGALNTGTECCDASDTTLFDLTCQAVWNANTGAAVATCGTAVASGTEFNVLCD